MPASARRAMSSAWCDGPTYMNDRDAVLEPFDALVGTWATEDGGSRLSVDVAPRAFEGRPMPGVRDHSRAE